MRRQVMQFIAFRAAKQLMADLGRAPTIREMATESRFPEHVVYPLMREIDGSKGLPFRFAFGERHRALETSGLRQDDIWGRGVRSGSRLAAGENMPVDAFMRLSGVA